MAGDRALVPLGIHLCGGPLLWYLRVHHVPANDTVQMAARVLLGPFEQLILIAILMLRNNPYGVAIHAKVNELTRPKKTAPGPIYVALSRLEVKGLVSSWLAKPATPQGGRARRCYRLETAGEQALKESAVIAKRIWDGLVDLRGQDWITDGNRE